MPKTTKKWEIFPGRNKFYCDGRVMMAPHTGVFYITVFLIVATSSLFFVFDCPYLALNVSPLIPAVSGLLFVFVMSALLRTSFSDPGVIPRASVDEAALYDKQIGANSNSPTYRPPPRTKEVFVRGQPVKLKYCFTCKIFRPPRASHCSLCDNCVDRFDHHCPWVGNCVGRRNYRYFYMFIVSLAFLCVFMFACVITHLVMISREMPFLDAVKDSPASVVIAVVCFFSVWSILGLAGFHTYLASSNQTTNEDIKGSFSSKRGIEGHNPYSEGNVCSNCFHVLCGPVPPSLLDRRGLVTDEMLAEIEKAKCQEPRNTVPLALYGTVKAQPQNGVFPALQDTCGTPNPLQQQCKSGSHAQSNGKVPPHISATANGELHAPPPPPVTVPPPQPPVPVHQPPQSAVHQHQPLLQHQPHQPPLPAPQPSRPLPQFANSVQDFRSLQLCPPPEYVFSNLQPRTTEKGILEPTCDHVAERPRLHYGYHNASYRKPRKRSGAPPLDSPDERTHLGGAYTLPRKTIAYAKQQPRAFPHYAYNYAPRPFISSHMLGRGGDGCFLHAGDPYKTLLLPFEISDSVASHAIQRRNLVEQERLRIEVEFGVREPPRPGSTSGSTTRLVGSEQMPAGSWQMDGPTSSASNVLAVPIDSLLTHSASAEIEIVPNVIDIDDVLPRSPSSLTLRSFCLDDSQTTQENIIMSNIDRTLHGNSKQLSAWKLRYLQEATMIESALDLDNVEENSVNSGNGSQTGLLKPPFLTPTYPS